MATKSAGILDCRAKVDNIEIAWIPLSDGRRLAARLLLPKDAAANPVPAILEYIPYRRRDGTRGRDDESHYWFAANGYACARVDISGAGDSDGLIEDEYVKREQDDALEVIAWLADQRWCSGTVGMIGISWGGFNGLQVAARRPPALKAVVSLCSTVDRYLEDCHIMGGCLLNGTLGWGSAFFSYGALPPDPEMVGPKTWRAMWRKRLEGLEFYPALWMKHQRRDAFWRQGSVIENYDAIEAPVLAVSGWADGYTAAVFQLVEGLKAPCKGIVGPWGHKYPESGVPGPAIGFLQECKRWWDHWLKGIDTGVEDDPDMRLYLQDAALPKPHHDERPGRWLGIPKWPTAKIKDERLHFNGDALARKQAGRSSAKSHRSVLSPQSTGLRGGEWCAYGQGQVAPELPFDQREDDAGSMVIDGVPLAKDLAIVGSPVVRLRIAADKPQAMIAVRLNDVRPDGVVSRISYGLLNLAHRDSHARPKRLKPGEFYDVTIRLNQVAQVVPAGHCLRVAISTSYWPLAWPSPEAARVTVDTAGSSIDVPLLRGEAGFKQVHFEPPQIARPMPVTVSEPHVESREVIQDVEAQTTTMLIQRDDGRYVIEDIGTEMTCSKREEQTISRDDPDGVTTTVAWHFHYRRGAWDARTQTVSTMSSDKTHFHLSATVKAYDRGKLFAERAFKESIKRDHM